MPFVKGEHHSKETREKMRISHTGSHHSLEHCKRISDAKKGKTHLSEETRKRMSESAKKRIRYPYSLTTRQKISNSLKGKKHSPEHCRKNGDAHKGMTHNEKTRKQISVSLIGIQAKEKHWNWKGGISPLVSTLRNCIKMDEWKWAVAKRDNYTCFYTGSKKNLCVHHIIPFSYLIEKYNITTYEQAINCDALWEVSNGITMSKMAHRWYHSLYGIKNIEKEE